MEKALKCTLPNGRFANVTLKRSRAMAAVKGKHNKTTEIRFRMALVRAGVSGWFTHGTLPGKPDIYFPNQKLAVFLDGCFWHGCGKCGHVPKSNSLFWSTKIERNKMRDKRNTRLLRAAGIGVIRLWEHSLNKPHLLHHCVQQIQKRVQLSRI